MADLDAIEQVIISGDFDVNELIAELDEIIKVAKGTAKTHKGRDLTNWNRAIALKAQLMGKDSGEGFADSRSPKAIEIDETRRQELKRLAHLFLTSMTTPGGTAFGEFLHTDEQLKSIAANLSEQERERIITLARFCREVKNGQ
jgi:hypothetical protein